MIDMLSLTANALREDIEDLFHSVRNEHSKIHSVVIRAQVILVTSILPLRNRDVAQWTFPARVLFTKAAHKLGQIQEKKVSFAL